MVSLIRHLLNHPLGDSFRCRAGGDLLSFMCCFILHEEPLSTKENEFEECGSAEDFQKWVDIAFQKMNSRDWGTDANDYKCIAEPPVLDCRLIKQLSSC